jgi:TIR domain
MTRDKFSSIEKVSRIVREALSRGATVDIDGLGSFRKLGRSYHFQPLNLPRVFVAYVTEDADKADRISDALSDAGFDPWMDRRKLLPGQNWGRAIQNAMETSQFVVACFSDSSIRKRGGFQAEVKYALEYARRLPLGETFLLPVRLNDCPVPIEVAREMQYVDLFPDWDAGIGRLLEAIRQQIRRPRAA